MPQLTNQLPLSIAPQMTALLPTPVDLAADGSLTLETDLRARPAARSARVMILGGHEVLAEPFAATTTTPTFVFRRFSPGKYWVRLRVDGVDSRLIDYKATPPAFIGQQIEVKP